MKLGASNGSDFAPCPRMFELRSMLVISLTLAGCAGESAVDPEPTALDAGAVADAGTGVDAGPPRCTTAVGALEPLDAPSLSPPPDADQVACAARVFDDRLNDARIVCLGEDDHGTTEAPLGHALLLRHLIVDRGARTVALEGTEASAEYASRFLSSRAAFDLNAAFQDGTGTFADTESWEALYRFLAEIQASLPDGEAIHLTGFDVAIVPGATITSILLFLDRVEPGSSADWAPRLRRGGASTVDAVDELLQLAAQNLDTYTNATSAADVQRFERDLFNLLDGQRFIELYRDAGFDVANATYREPRMFQNMRALEMERQGLIVMLAHNAHCNRSGIIGLDADGNGVVPVGTALAAVHGDDYRTIMQLYESGSHLSPGAGGFRSMAYRPPPGGFEFDVFAISNAAAFFLRIDAPGLPSDQSYLGRAGRPRYTPNESFDGIFGIRSVTPTTFR